jgi:hypothetical protein
MKFGVLNKLFLKVTPPNLPFAKGGDEDAVHVKARRR